MLRCNPGCSDFSDRERLRDLYGKIRESLRTAGTLSQSATLMVRSPAGITQVSPGDAVVLHTMGLWPVSDYVRDGVSGLVVANLAGDQSDRGDRRNPVDRSAYPAKQKRRRDLNEASAGAVRQNG